MATPKKTTLGSLIGEQKSKPTPDNYPSPTAHKSRSPESTPKPSRAKAAKAKPPKQTSRKPEARKVISVDLSMSHFKALRDIADELDCSRTEAIRALINVAVEEKDMLAKLQTQLDAEGVHRPSGFAARTS